jgi:hypothetical protein
MRKIWVFLLATIAAAVGAFGGLAYTGAKGSLASFRIGCELLNTAEGASVLDKGQRADVVDRVIREMQKTASSGELQGVDLVEQLKTGCPNLPKW